MSPFQLFKLSMLWSLLPNSIVPNSQKSTAGPLPSICSTVECPTYYVVDGGSDYEIRLYDSPVWISTSPLKDFSFLSAATRGAVDLTYYMQGNNEYNESMGSTAPFIIQASGSGDESISDPLSFVVGVYLPKKNQADPPPAEGFNVLNWERPTFVAVREFNTFTGINSEVYKEAEALNASLATLPGWSPFNSSFWLAQYDFSSTFGEIWMLLNVTYQTGGYGSL